MSTNAEESVVRQKREPQRFLGVIIESALTGQHHGFGNPAQNDKLSLKLESLIRCIDVWQVIGHLFMAMEMSKEIIKGTGGCPVGGHRERYRQSLSRL